MALDRGSSRPSGNGEVRSPSKKTSPQKKCKCDILQEKVSALEHVIETLHDEIARHIEVNKKLTDAVNETKRVGWDDRSLVKLKSYEYFHSRILNAQTHCKADKEYLNELLEDVRYVLQNAGV
jgi:hypothetical protein